MKKIFISALVFFLQINMIFGQKTIFMEEGFEGGVFPVGWQTINNDGEGENWTIQGTTFWAHTGNNCASVMVHEQINPDKWLITPQINLTENTILTYYAANLAQNEFATLNLLISTSGNSISDFNLVETNTVYCMGYDDSYIYTQLNYDLTLYTNQQIYIAFQVVSPCGGMFIIDDISVSTSGIAYPICNIISPADEATFERYEIIDFEIDATISIGNITKVELWLNETTLLGTDYEAPYEIAWNTDEVLVGVYDIYAVAYNDLGYINTTDEYITVNIIDFLPSCNITYPSANQKIIQNSIININAIAEDDNQIGKNITIVEFFVDDVKIGEDLTEPFEYEWNTQGVDIDMHTIKIIATDAHQNVSNNEKIVEIIEEYSANRIEWNKILGTQNIETSLGIIETSDNNYISIGQGNFQGKNSTQAIKLDESGNIIWSYIYNSQYNNYSEDIVETFDQNNNSTGFLITGNIDLTVNDALKLLVIKIDENGNLEWQKIFGLDNTQSEGFCAIQTNDLNYLVAGYKGTPNGINLLPYVDGWLIKLDQNGDEIWNQIYGSTQIYIFDFISEIIENEDNSLVFVGYTHDNPNSPGVADFWIVKTDENGNTIWEQKYGTSEIDIARSIDKTNDNGYIVGGHYYTVGGFSDWKVVKINDLGEIQWQKEFDGDQYNDNLYSIKQTALSNYILAGYLTESTNFSKDVWVMKLDNAGNVLWEEIYGTIQEDDVAYSICQSSDLGYILGGFTSSFGFGSSDTWIIKLEPDETIDINEFISNDNFSIFPNPTSGNFTRSNKNDVSNNFIVNIYNNIGECIFNSTKISNNQSIDLSMFEKGVYYVEIFDNKTKTTKKLIIK